MSSKGLSFTTTLAFALVLVTLVSLQVNGRVVKRQYYGNQYPEQNRDLELDTDMDQENEASVRRKRYQKEVRAVAENEEMKENEEDEENDQELELRKREIQRRQAKRDAESEFVTLDTNGDGAIQYSEGLNALEQTSSGENKQVEKEDVERYTSRFETLDKNDDGVLELNEISE